MQPVAKPRPADRRARFRTRTGGFAVRSLLAETMATLAGWGYPPQGRGRVELVLAEVLNNVVEHGYGNRAGRPVALALQLTGAGLTCIVTDRGRPYPDNRLPEGGRPASPAPATGCPRADSAGT